MSIAHNIWRSSRSAARANDLPLYVFGLAISTIVGLGLLEGVSCIVLAINIQIRSTNY
ncbi:MAG: hypothetical protein CM1200mP6_07880 [Anaerolineaceae bacterium]|nr:MAG: hypothetical protein CM1200mP6_07880 [Anaerolineaceae bacterium]